MGVLVTAVGGVGILLAATVAFDVVHVSLHRAAEARAPWLRRVGSWHAVHHRFLGPDLQVDERLVAANIRWHVLPEYATHLAVTLPLLLVLPMGPVAVALAIETAVVAAILRDRGLDVNHRSRTRVPAYRPSLLCLPAYHALHHVRPTAHFSSWISIVDRALGTTMALRGRRTAVVGPSGGLRDALADELGVQTGRPAMRFEAAGHGLPSEAVQADLLVLAPDPATSLATIGTWVEDAATATADRLVPIEVWTVVAAAETGRAAARSWMVDQRLVYRHVVVPPGTVETPRETARRIVARARRGAHRIHTGSCGLRVRAWGAWQATRPDRRGVH